MASASHHNPPTQRDGARIVGRVIPIHRDDEPKDPIRNAFQIGRDYQRGLVGPRLEALEAHIADLELRLDRLEGGE